MKLYCSAGVRKSVSALGIRCRFMLASWNSYSKSETARRPRRMTPAPTSSTRSASSVEKPRTSMLGIPASATRASEMRSLMSRLGPLLVESAIALSVLLAALNNLRPLVLGRRWIVAFAFGLVHGFGFASVLAELGLPPDALLVALLGFNLGVEAGQLAIVALFLPAAFGIRRTWLYRRLLFSGGSAAIALVALGWLLERSLDLKLVPGWI